MSNKMRTTEGETPVLRSCLTSPSSAHEPWESKLDRHRNRTLNKKSLFGSLRNVVHKGALQAKMAVDVFRGEQSQPENAPPESERHGDHIHDMEAGDSANSLECDSSAECDSWCARSSESFQEISLLLHQQKSGFSSRNSRPNAPPLWARHHHKHSAACKAARKAKSEMSLTRSGNNAASTKQKKGSNAGHKKHKSLAGSLTGSIRGLRRGVTKSQLASTQSLTSPEKQAENVPLPSSPINIPSDAPFVELDLGPTGFMSSTFPSPEDKEQKREGLARSRRQSTKVGRLEERAEMKKFEAASSGSKVHWRPKDFYFSVLSDQDAPSASFNHPLRPRDLLDVPPHSAEAFGDDSDSGRSTPIPSTWVDGANGDRSDTSQVFERSVTPSNKKERKELRTMCSLDAMAEDYDFSNAANNAEEFTGPGQESHAARSTSPEMNASAEIQFYTPRCDTSSGSTLSSPPSDMPELCRQKNYKRDSLEKLVSESLTEDDPFITNERVGIGPPSPERSVVLPFRPRFMTRESEVFIASDAQDEAPGQMTSGFGQRDKAEIQPSPFRFGTTPKTEQEPAHSYTFKRYSIQETDLSSTQNLGSDDDTQTRAQDLLTSDIVLSSYEKMNSPESDGLSPHAGSLVPELYNRIQTKQSSTPGSARSRTTYTAGLGDCEYKFTFESWLRGTSMAPAPDEQPRTPHRRSMDVSIDSVSMNDERQTPQVSPMLTSNGNTPLIANESNTDPSHAQPDMGQQALGQNDLIDELGANLVEKTPPFRTTVDSSVEIDANAFQFADFEQAYTSSRAGSPRRDSQVAPGRSDKDGTEASGSSADSPPIRQTGQVKQRVASLDSLDDSLRLFSSPDSGYDADKGLASPPEMTKGPLPSWHHSLRKRDGAKQALAELSNNVV